MPALVSLQRVVKEFPLGKVVVSALRGVDLEIERGEFTSIAGPSGSGKTTLLNLVGCIDVPTSGHVVLDGRDVGALGERERTRLRLERIGFIFQSFNLIGVLDVFQNVEFPLLLQGGISTSERRERVEAIVERVGLAEHRRHRPSELSGGQRQRVAIARALVTRPALVLADEPTANLDSVTGDRIIELMRSMNETEQTTFVFSTHDADVMRRASRIVRIADGLVVDANAGLSAALGRPEGVPA